MAWLFWSMIFGAVGMGYFVYGKREQRGIAFLSGVLLCVFPYFVSNVLVMILLGALFMALPFFVPY